MLIRPREPFGPETPDGFASVHDEPDSLNPPNSDLRLDPSGGARVPDAAAVVRADSGEEGRDDRLLGEHRPLYSLLLSIRHPGLRLLQRTATPPKLDAQPSLVAVRRCSVSVRRVLGGVP